MSKTLEKSEIEVGTEISGPTRRMTQERVEWYSIALFSGASDERRPVQENIHTSLAFAKSQGLKEAIADGMHSTNWVSTMLTDAFGEDYIARGELRTKYIKPTPLNAVITPRATVTGAESLGSEGMRYTLDVWCEDETGTKLTVGDAAVTVQ